MLISNNKKPPIDEFEVLVDRTVYSLNVDASKRPDYYKSRSGTKLEEDVYRMMVEKAKGTAFEGSIELISNQRFPDIVASKYYGVEVKTTKSNTWTSTGSSIVESTRVKSVEKIFLLFGKLSEQVEFRAKLYEECLSEIVVTHSPRYKIDMNLELGETIFEKMDVEYDVFRKNDTSINMVKDYYKSQLKQGQKLWWITQDDLEQESSVSPIVKLWGTLNGDEKRKLQIESFAWFPEIFGSSSQKYNRVALWLVTHKAVVNTSLRDTFTAGGRMEISTSNNKWYSQPHIYYQLSLVKEEIKEVIQNAEEEWLKEIWELGDNPLATDRMKQWVDLIVIQAKEHKEMLYEMFDL